MGCYEYKNFFLKWIFMCTPTIVLNISVSKNSRDTNIIISDLIYLKATVVDSKQSN